jgi:hypothetical protein
MQVELKTEVIARWKQSGQPPWSAAQTLAVTEQLDQAFERVGSNPAPRFREERLAGNLSFLANWIGGCRFSWLRGAPSGAQTPNREGDEAPLAPQEMLKVIEEALDGINGVCRLLNDTGLSSLEEDAHALRVRLEEVWALLGGTND